MVLTILTVRIVTIIIVVVYWTRTTVDGFVTEFVTRISYPLETVLRCNLNGSMAYAFAPVLREST